MNCRRTAAETEGNREAVSDRTVVVVWRSFVGIIVGKRDVVRKVVTGWSTYSDVVQYADVLWVALT